MKLLFPMALPSWKENGTRWCWPPRGCMGTQPRCHPLRPQAWLRLPGAGRKDHVSLRSRCLLNSSCQKNSKCFCFPPPKKKQPLEEEEPEHQRVSSLHWPDLNRLSLSVRPCSGARPSLSHCPRLKLPPQGEQEPRGEGNTIQVRSSSPRHRSSAWHGRSVSKPGTSVTSSRSLSPRDGGNSNDGA